MSDYDLEIYEGRIRAVLAGKRLRFTYADGTWHERELRDGELWGRGLGTKEWDVGFTLRSLVAGTWSIVEHGLKIDGKDDLILRSAICAARKFGGDDGMFNAAGFSSSLMSLAGLNGVVDGILVRAILSGRDDIEPMPDGAHFRLKIVGEPGPKPVEEMEYDELETELVGAYYVTSTPTLRRLVTEKREREARAKRDAEIDAMDIGELRAVLWPDAASGQDARAYLTAVTDPDSRYPGGSHENLRVCLAALAKRKSGV